jgi:hypothetical protein
MAKERGWEPGLASLAPQGRPNAMQTLNNLQSSLRD